MTVKKVTVSRTRIDAISEKAEKRIAERAKEIAEFKAKKAFRKTPTGNNPQYLTPYRSRPANERYQNSFEVKKERSKDGGTRYFLTNKAQTRKTRGAQKEPRSLAAIIEKGSRAHRIAPTGKNYLHWLTVDKSGNVSGVWIRKNNGDGKKVPAPVDHPGTKPKHIMRDSVREAVAEYKRGDLK